MKRGKIVLSLVALVCTVAGALAMKSTKLTGGLQCYTKASGTLKAVNCWTTAGFGSSSVCNLGTAPYFTSGGTKITNAAKCTLTN